ASDVTRALENELRRLGVSIRLNTRVQKLLLEGGRVAGVETADGQTLRADSVILCTGGASYQSTGSTGDGYRLLAQCGHEVFPPLAALVGLCCEEAWVTELQGLTLKNVRLTLKHGNKTLYTDIGEMLFTHFGVSGPLALSVSSYMAELDARECAITLDLKPGLSEQQLDARVLRDVGAAGRKELRTLLCGLYPARLEETMERLCQLDGRKQANLLTREERGALVQTTKALPLPVTALRPLAEAVVTRGGLDVRQVSPSTMESKLVPGLYVSGELLDVDALTGGFNLHIAFATGFAAGRAAAQGRVMNE
ncbi:MAG: aminoacetone oxidase family FAD-binding enzyme, partial [Clostridia bacterium]|nr:aminoacetone oxidase family FAD-binding enzyme [Clostridia bacterium]